MSQKTFSHPPISPPLLTSGGGYDPSHSACFRPVDPGPEPGLHAATAPDATPTGGNISGSISSSSIESHSPASDPHAISSGTSTSSGEIARSTARYTGSSPRPESGT